MDALKRVFDFRDTAKRNKQVAAMVTIDAKNAFNAVPWEQIDMALEAKKVPGYLRKLVQSYLGDRHLDVGDDRMCITAGVPQGSVLGPLLWCMYYDQILELETEVGVSFCCYADDLAILVRANNQLKLGPRVSRAVQSVTKKFGEIGLAMAAEKTDIVLLASKKEVKQISVEVEGIVMSSKEEIKFLGVWLQTDMVMEHNARMAAAKADKVSCSLSKLMPSAGGPGQAARRVLAGTVEAILLYGVQAWGNYASEEVWKELERPYHRTRTRVIAGYSSMAVTAAGIISGMPPLDLRGRELALRSEGASGREARQSILNEWLKRWDNGQGSTWTRRVLREPRMWLERRHGEVEACHAYALSGHGPFGEYERQRKFVECGRCPSCYSVPDDVEHAVFGCTRWRVLVEGFERGGRTWTPEDLVSGLLASPEEWREATNLLRLIFGGRRMNCDWRRSFYWKPK